MGRGGQGKTLAKNKKRGRDHTGDEGVQESSCICVCISTQYQNTINGEMADEYNRDWCL